ncbi:MAG TPA: metallophosphoesterase [Phycisphaerae bacterium]|nr:metallophosphoesterase [Phycisphaerae bacterium]
MASNHSIFFQPHVDVFDLPCARLPAAFDGLVLLHLSDLHITRWTRRLDLWREQLSLLKPDVLVITGDLGHRSWLWKTSFDSVVKLLEPLTPPLGTFFILGNHDSIKLGPAIAQTKDPAGRPRTLLRNQSIFIERTDGRFHIAAEGESGGGKGRNGAPRLALIGVNQHRRIDTDIPGALRQVTPGDFKLMLLHYPDLIHPAVAAGADICLAGHTHGGQICWPDGSPLFRHDTLPAAMTTGVHRVNGTWMIVNRGIGAAGVKMRLFCPPQAIQITLRSAVPMQ